MNGRKNFLVYCAVPFAVIVIAIFAVGWYASEKVIHPPVDPPLDPLKYPLLREDVYFKSRDGLKLAGWFIPGTNGATIILAHGRGSDHSHELPNAVYLHADGFSVFMFDFRYRGKSEGDAQTLGAKESWDIQSAVDYLRTRHDVDPDRIGVQGNSLGAASAILAAAETGEIKGVVAEIAFKSVNGVLNHTFPRIIGLPSFPFALVTKLICEFRLGVDLDEVAPDKAIAKISPRPVFLIDNSDDDLFPCDSVEVLYKAAKQPKVLWQVPGAPHGQGRQTAPEEYERRVLAFWRKTFVISSSRASEERLPR